MDPEDDPQLAVEVPAEPIQVLSEQMSAYHRQLGRYEAVQMYGLLRLAFAVLNIDDRLTTLPLQHATPLHPLPPLSGSPPGEAPAERPEAVAGWGPEPGPGAVPAYDPAPMLSFVPPMPGVTTPEAGGATPGTVASALRLARFTGPLMSWFYANERAETAARVVVSTVEDCSLQRAHSLISRAIVAYVGLPRLTAHVLQGRVPFERLAYTARKSTGLTLAQLDVMDEAITAIAHKSSLRAVRRQVDLQLAVLVPEDETAEQVQEQRAVLFETLPDGSASLTLRGPVAPLSALYARTLACARAVVRDQLDAFGLKRDDTGAEQAARQLEEDRTIPQAMFDLLAGAAPSTQVTVTGEDGTQLLEVSCPTSAEWLRRQASVSVTVPVLTLLGDAQLPGILDGRHPVPAATARQFAAEASTLYRLLTDPATGEVLDEPAQRYTVPRSMRATVQAAWIWCTAPGCSRRAATSEIDHIDAYDHSAPSAGGQTQLENLQPLCKKHHELKTRGALRVTRGDDGMLRWKVMFGLEAETAKPGNPIECRQAQILARGRPPAGAEAVAGSTAEETAGDGAGPVVEDGADPVVEDGADPVAALAGYVLGLPGYTAPNPSAVPPAAADQPLDPWTVGAGVKGADAPPF